MKRFIAISLTVLFVLQLSHKLFSQSSIDMQEFGITAGAFTNFPADQNYLKENSKVIYVAPYIRTGKHEFSAGIVYPLTTHAIYFNDKNIDPRIGAIAGYKFYVFNVFGRENMFVHYSFQYLNYKKDYNFYFSPGNQQSNLTETDFYVNNVIGVGYNLFFDSNERFGFYYTLDYVISQGSYRIGTSGFKDNFWTTKYIWNNLSTNFGFSFKLTSLKKKEKK